MSKNEVTGPITDQEMAFARLVAGATTDRHAAGLNPESAAYTKSKPHVRAYMLEHCAAVQQQLVQQDAEGQRLLNLDPNPDRTVVIPDRKDAVNPPDGGQDCSQGTGGAREWREGWQAQEKGLRVNVANRFSSPEALLLSLHLCSLYSRHESASENNLLPQKDLKISNFKSGVSS